MLPRMKFRAIGLVAFMLALFAWTPVAFADKVVGSNITVDTTWTTASGTIIIWERGISIASGVTLTIEPGVVVKFERSGGITVNGTLNAIGTTEAPIHFLSIADDTVGGDTNGDGAASNPGSFRWADIGVRPGGSAVISHAVMTYGGYPRYFPADGGSGGNVSNSGGLLNITDTVISQGSTYGIVHYEGTSTVTRAAVSDQPFGIFMRGGKITIANSDIHDNATAGVFTDTGGELGIVGSTFTNNGSAVRFKSFARFTPSANTASGTGAFYTMYGNVSGDVTLRKDGAIPYAIEANFGVPYGTSPDFTVLPGASFTVDPGVVVKFPRWAGIVVKGTLNAVGTEEAPIQFTSMKDDSVGGDTNGDGAATAPAPGDWTDIFIGTGGIANIAHATARYGGSTHYRGADPSSSANIANFSGTLSLSHTEIASSGQFGLRLKGGVSDIRNVEIHDNPYGVYSDDGTTQDTTIRSSEIYNNTYGVTVWTGTLFIEQSSIHDNATRGAFKPNTSPTPTVLAEHNYWGAPDGPSGQGPGTGDAVSSYVDFAPFLTTDPLLAPTCTVNCNSNVLFLPGFEASRLFSTDGGETRLWEPPAINGDAAAQQLIMQPDGSSTRSDIYARGILDQAYVVGKGNVYYSFIKEMNMLASTSKINAWKPIAYDWRLSVEDILDSGSESAIGISYLTATSTPYIMQELHHLAQTSRTGKVTIIAHSNGGILAKMMMHKLGPTITAQLIDKVILVASPQVGTPQGMAGMLHGHDQALPVAWLPTALSGPVARAMGDTMPGAYGLLPSAPYFTYADDPVVTFSTSTLPAWATEYGDVIHSQERLHKFLADPNSFRTDPLSDVLEYPTKLNGTLLIDAERIHSMIDGWTPPPGVQVIQIAGWGVPTTVKGIEYANSANPFCTIMCESHLTISASTTIDGDGTVVVPSALWVANSESVTNYWFNLEKYNSVRDRVADGRLFTVKHANIFEPVQLLKFISDIILTSQQPLSDYEYLNSDSPPSSKTRLRYGLHSPLTLNLYDDLGRHTGVSTTTGEIVEDIPGTYYTEFGDVKYVFADADAPMHVVMSGYDTGTFTLNVDQYQGDTPTGSVSFTDVPTTPQTVVTMDVQSDVTTVSPLSIDTGAGAIDTYVAPDGESLSIEQLMVNLTTAIQHLDVKDKLKTQLLHRVVAIQKKFDKQMQKQTNVLAKLQAQIQKGGAGGKIDAEEAEQISAIIDELEAYVTSIPLDSSLLADLANQIETLDAKPSLKKSFLKKVARLQNISTLIRSLANFSTIIMRKKDAGKVSEEEARQVLDILGQLQNEI